MSCLVASKSLCVVMERYLFYRFFTTHTFPESSSPFSVLTDMYWVLAVCSRLEKDVVLHSRGLELLCMWQKLTQSVAFRPGKNMEPILHSYTYSELCISFSFFSFLSFPFLSFPFLSFPFLSFPSLPFPSPFFSWAFSLVGDYFQFWYLI